MAIVAAECKLYKSAVVNDLTTNGGIMSTTQVVSGVLNNLFPPVYEAERTAGWTRYRKAFFKVANDADLTLYYTKLYLGLITPGDDWVTMFLGTQTDTAASIAGTERKYGAAPLYADASSGAGSITVNVENSALVSGNDQIFKDGDTIIITDKAYPGATGNQETHIINGAPSVSGTQMTLTLTGTLASSYTVSGGTKVMSCLLPAGTANPVAASCGTVTATTAGDGEYDETNYPVDLDNIGTINQTVTLTFTSASAFTATSNVAGVSLGTGTTAGDFSPTNPDFSKPYFTLDASGWTGTWTAGDTLVFSTVPAAVPIWFKQVGPAGCASLANNKSRLCFMGESA